MDVRTLAKQAGERDAFDTFGLSATSKPPPTWAHGRRTQIGSITERKMPHGCKKCHERICTCA